MILSKEEKEVLKKCSLSDWFRANGYKNISDNYDGDHEHEWQKADHNIWVSEREV